MKNEAVIPYSHQSISGREKRSVLKVLESSWLTQGPKVVEFEKKLAEAVGAKFAVAVSSGTAALHLACLALGVEEGSEVITSPNTFLATSNSIVFCGGKPVFADLDSETFNIDPQEIKRKIRSKAKGILPVHFSGHPCDMKSIYEIASQRDLFILEDGCHALGARYKIGSQWFKVGSCAHSDACVFSFHPVKSITTGEGGAITTNRKEVYEHLLSLRTHGMVKRSDLFRNQELAFWSKNGEKHPVPWYYEMQTLGFNYRITDLQCAIGISQLSRLKKFIKRRREIVETYNRAFGKLNTLEIPREKAGFESACHLYVIQLRLENLSANRAEIYEEMRRKGLGVQVHYIPVHLQPYYRKFGYRLGDYPRAEAYYERAISLPVFPAMTAAQVRGVTRIVTQILNSHEG